MKYFLKEIAPFWLAFFGIILMIAIFIGLLELLNYWGMSRLESFIGAGILFCGLVSIYGVINQ